MFCFTELDSQQGRKEVVSWVGVGGSRVILYQLVALNLFSEFFLTAFQDALNSQFLSISYNLRIGLLSMNLIKSYKICFTM